MVTISTLSIINKFYRITLIILTVKLTNKFWKMLTTSFKMKLSYYSFIFKENTYPLCNPKIKKIMGPLIIFFKHQSNFRTSYF